MKNRDTYIVTITDEPGYTVPLACRLRKFLKDALRRYGLRCTGIVASAPVHRSDTTPTRTHDESSDDDGRANVALATDERPRGEQ